MVLEILDNGQIAEADRRAIESGIAGYDLMERAGQSVADIICRYYEPQPVLILCGPGNNGGDGFVIARTLSAQNFSVTLACLVAPLELKGDALKAADNWLGDVRAIEELKDEATGALVVDALFGTGFPGSLPERLQRLLRKIKESGSTVIAVDIPSGVQENGAADPYSLKADHCVTFARKKTAHILSPGRALCGRIHVVDIGISDEIIAQVGHEAQENEPSLWRHALKGKRSDRHKYNYGHAVIYGGPRMTGAACLAAHAAMRVGAGLCSVVADPSAGDIYRSYQPNLLYEPLAALKDFPAHLADARRNAVLIGPGAGQEAPEALRQMILAVLRTEQAGEGRGVVLDADVLRGFSDKPSRLFEALKHHGDVILTPHEGEFARLFPDLAGHKIKKAKDAAARSGAVILLKGAETVIASPEGECVVNCHASPWLASAGTGDVLAGMVTGLRAQAVTPFPAACAAVWLHGEASLRIGPGLVAQDLPEQLPAVLADLLLLPNK